MRRTSTQSGVIAGGIAAAATAGALVAVGRRVGVGGALVPFDAIGRILSGAPRSLAGWSIGSVLLGVVLHVAVVTFWAVIGVRLVIRWRGRTLGAALAATAAWFSASWLMARLTGRGLATLLPLGDHVLLAVVFAISLVVGMRFAFSAHTIA